MTEKEFRKRTLLAPGMTDKDREKKALADYFAKKAEYSKRDIFLTAETNPNHLPGMQYMKPLDEYIIYDEEDPLSGKHIEALSHLMKSKQQYKPIDYTLLATSIVWAILVFLLLLI